MSNVPRPEPVPMPRRRRWLVYALSGGLIVGHAFDVATKGEHWPISSYPMYADRIPSTFTLVRLFGRTDEDPPRDLPIDSAWIRGTLQRALRRPDREAQLRKTIIQYASAYGWERRAEYGATFVAYSVYEQDWTLSAYGDPSRLPDASKLLFELKREGADATTTTAPAPPTTGEAPRDAAR